MAVQPLDCVEGSIPIANGGGVAAVPQHLMVEKSSQLHCAAVKVGSNEPPIQQRRVSARIRARQTAAEELQVRQKAEVEADNGKSVVAVASAAAANKRCRASCGGEGQVVSEQKKQQKREVGGAGRTVDFRNAVGGEDRVSDGEVVSEQKKEGEVVCEKPEVEGLERTVDLGNAAAEAVADDNGCCSIKVKETIRLYNKHFLQCVQEEEKRCGEAEAAAKKHSKSKSKKKGEGDLTEKTRSKRPDLKALSKMMQNNEVLYPEKRIGHIPGVEVGYRFYSRSEMVAVGFHSHWLNGIDYMGQSYAKLHSSSSYGLKFPVAVSIVISGQYEDDLDNAEDVVYTGQGGHNLTGDKRQIRDQKLELGNLALKNCVEQNVPVRVTRGHQSKNSGHQSKNSYWQKVYTYDGLYKAVEYWAEKGISGFTVYKFLLRRLEGQSGLTTNQVYFTNGRVPQSLAEIRGLVCQDITGGQEDMPIPATNLVDDPPVPPTGFTYLKSLRVAKNVKLPMNAAGCKCKGFCTDPTTCECARRNGSDFPYVSKDGGRLVEAKDVVFECGPNCGCGPGCVNRTSQKGVRYRLEVFRTAKKGWAVRSWDFIPAGAPVCEYTGVLARTDDMDSVLDNSYIFEIDCLQTIKGLGGRERRSQNAAAVPANLLDDQGSESAPEFCIDAGSTGNVARFINHCCEPNLFVQCVLSTHHDLTLARVMLFAADNIAPLQELTYDYGYELDSVLGPEGKIMQMPCYCGDPGCRKRLF